MIAPETPARGEQAVSSGAPPQASAMTTPGAFASPFVSPLGVHPQWQSPGVQYTPGTLLGGYSGSSMGMAPFGANMYGFGAAQPAPWLQSLQATVGGMGALAELVGMTAEAGKHFGQAFLAVLEVAGQTAGEVVGLVEPHPPVDAATGRPLVPPQEHLRTQRERAARWLIGGSALVVLVWAGRAAMRATSSGSFKGLRVLLLVLAGAIVGYTHPDLVEDKTAQAVNWAQSFLRSIEQVSAAAPSASASAMTTSASAPPVSESVAQASPVRESVAQASSVRESVAQASPVRESVAQAPADIASVHERRLRGSQEP
jgi:hypothetical protein